MSVGKGHATVFGFKHNPNAWGLGGAVACGAGDGIPANQESLVTKAMLIQNKGLFGSVTQLPGTKGTDLTDGTLEIDTIYQGLEPMIAMLFGTAGTPTTIVAGAFSHTFQIAQNTEGLLASLVATDPVWNREWPYLKVDSLEFDWQPGKFGTLKLGFIAFGLNMNVGAPSSVNVVANAADANVTYTLLATAGTLVSTTLTLFVPSQIQIVHTGTPTAFNLTISGTDRDGNVISEVFSLTTAGTFVTVNYFATITGIVGSGLSGTPGTTQCGTLNGVNNSTTVASITLPIAPPPFVNFGQCSFQQNPAGGTAFPAIPVLSTGPSSTGTLYAISRFNLKLERKLKKGDVTTRFAPQQKVDEPVGGDFLAVTGGFGFSKLMGENFQQAFLYANKGLSKMLVQFQGGLIGATAIPYLWQFYLPAVQYDSGTHNVKGPGEVPLDIKFQGYDALVAPAGWPGFSSGSQACTMVVQSGRSTNALA
jgi:hypothetical protein